MIISILSAIKATSWLKEFFMIFDIQMGTITLSLWQVKKMRPWVHKEIGNSWMTYNQPHAEGCDADFPQSSLLKKQFWPWGWTQAKSYMGITFVAAVTNTTAEALKLGWASRTPGGLVKTLIAMPHPQGFCFSRSGMRVENWHLSPVMCQVTLILLTRGRWGPLL